MRLHSLMTPASTMPETLQNNGFPAASRATAFSLAMTAGSMRTVSACLPALRRSAMGCPLSAPGSCDAIGVTGFLRQAGLSVESPAAGKRRLSADMAAAQAAERGERGIGREAALGRGEGRAGLGARNRRMGEGHEAGAWC